MAKGDLINRLPSDDQNYDAADEARCGGWRWNWLVCNGENSIHGAKDRWPWPDVEKHGPFAGVKWGYSTKGQNAIVQIDILFLYGALLGVLKA